MSRLIRGFSLMVLVSCAGYAQTAGPAVAVPLSFEVAAIKPSVTNDNGSGTHTSKGEVVMNNVSLKQCVEMAYDVRDYSFSGPDWLATLRFDINAKPPAGWDSREQFGPMLQTLLAERFKLVVHKESKVLPAYALVQAKGGLKIHPVEKGEGGSSSNSNNGLYTAKHVTMQRFADFLARTLNSPVVDKTEAAGVFDFSLTFSRDDLRPGSERSPDNSAPSIYTALQEQLGLRLLSQKLPVEIVVVDHMEKAPTDN
jgi:uncharacterized protein (TIGR03435 family)